MPSRTPPRATHVPPLSTGGDGGSLFSQKDEDYLRFIVAAERQVGGDRQGIQYVPIRSGQHCFREDEGEDIWGSPIEKLCRGDQNRLTDESRTDTFTIISKQKI